MPNASAGTDLNDRATQFAARQVRHNRSAFVSGLDGCDAIDIGQIEGGFVQGMGWLTTEQLVWNKDGVPAHFKNVLRALLDS